MLSTPIRKLEKFAQTNAAQRMLLIEAVLWLIAARLALSVMPFPKLARWFGHFRGPTDERIELADMPAATANGEMAETVGWAVACAASHLPFRAVCLPRAIAAKAMLKRRGIPAVMHFGVAKGTEEKPLEVHAWLDAVGVKVTGYGAAVQFTEIACFI